MSFWKPKFHDTTKMPEAYRRLVLHQAEKLLERLHELRDVALEYASEDALLHYVAVITLPPPDHQEEEDLDEPSVKNKSNEHGDAGIYANNLAQAESGFVQASNRQEGDDASSDAETEMENSEPVWDSAIHGYDWPNIEEPSEYESSSSYNENEESDDEAFDPFGPSGETTTPESNTWLTNTPGAPYSVFYNTFVSFTVSCFGDDHVVLSTGIENSSEVSQSPASAWLTNVPDGPSASDGNTQAEISLKTRSNAETTSQPIDGDLSSTQSGSINEEVGGSTPKTDNSNDTTSQTLDDEIEERQLTLNTLFHPYCWYWPSQFIDEFIPNVEKYEEYLQKKKDLINAISRNKALSQAEVDTILYEFVRENIVYKPTVNSAQLFKLKRFIDNVERFILAVQENIAAIDDDMNESRRRHYMPAGSPLRFRSKRLGSSLRFVTSVDEEWGMELDNWGMPPIMKRRQRI